jgi:hypothetical protein
MTEVSLQAPGPPQGFARVRHKESLKPPWHKPSPNPEDTGAIVHCPMGTPGGCDTAWDQTRVCSEASITAMQSLRPLRHWGGHLDYFYLRPILQNIDLTTERCVIVFMF